MISLKTMLWIKKEIERNTDDHKLCAIQVFPSSSYFYVSSNNNIKSMHTHHFYSFMYGYDYKTLWFYISVYVQCIPTVPIRYMYIKFPNLILLVLQKKIGLNSANTILKTGDTTSSPLC